MTLLAKLARDPPIGAEATPAHGEDGEIGSLPQAQLTVLRPA
jgi:hypothetical protein